jgi:hypothetical protein
LIQQVSKKTFLFVAPRITSNNAGGKRKEVAFILYPFFLHVLAAIKVYFD